MSNCVKYEPTLDRCQSCDPNWVLMEDNNVQKCVRKLDGCSTYDYVSEKCSACINEWYLLDQYCYPGGVLNCLEYMNNNVVNKCVKCKNTFYLTNNNTCESQPTITGCDTYL